MTNLDIWMREHTLTYVWLGSYAVALLIFLIEVFVIRRKRKQTLEQVKMIQEAGDED